MAVLSDVLREAIELAYFGGLTQVEVAERTATPLGTVKSRMRLGLLAMRRVLLEAEGAAVSSGASRAAGGETR
jgi:RNA polymerase sigma-70 factor (ECF subfamily)